MDAKTWTRKMSKGFSSITGVMVWIGCVALGFIVLNVFVSVFARYSLRHPLQGSYELVQQSLVIVGSTAIMYAAVRRGHVAIDLILARFPRRTQMIMQSIFSLLGFGTWAMLTYEVYLDMLKALKLSETTSAIDVYVAPFLFILVVGLFLCSLTLLVQAFHPKASEETKEGEVNEQ